MLIYQAWRFLFEMCQMPILLRNTDDNFRCFLRWLVAVEQWAICPPARPLYLNPYHFNQDLRGVKLQPPIIHSSDDMNRRFKSPFFRCAYSKCCHLYTPNLAFYCIHSGIATVLLWNYFWTSMFTDKQTESCKMLPHVCTFSISVHMFLVSNDDESTAFLWLSICDPWQSHI